MIFFDNATDTPLNICTRLNGQTGTSLFTILGSYAFATGNFSRGIGQAVLTAIQNENETAMTDAKQLVIDQATIQNQSSHITELQNNNTDVIQGAEGIGALIVVAFVIPEILAWNRKKKQNQELRDKGNMESQ